MQSQNLEKKLIASMEEEKLLKKDVEYYTEQVEKFNNAQTGTRFNNASLIASVPYILSMFACIGLSQYGLVNPTLAGPLCLGVPLAIGVVAENKLVKKVVDARTLSANNATNLRSEIFNRIKLAEAQGKLAEREGYQNRLLDKRYYEFELSEDVEDLKKKASTLDNDIETQEKFAESAAIKYVLQDKLKGYGSDFSVVRDLAKGAGVAVATTAVYNAPLLIAGLPITGLHIAIPATISFALAGPYQLAMNAEKRKLYKKYDGLITQDIDLEHPADLRRYNLDSHEFLGELEADRDICNEVLDSKIRVKK